MIQVTVCGGGELQGSEADVVEGLVVNAVGLVGVLDQLVDGQGGVVGLDDGVRNLRIKQPRSINTSLTSSFISVYCQI